MVEFWLCFVPLFVAVDAIGILPMFLSLVEGLDSSRIRAIILQSIVTATAVVLLFVALGKAVFDLLGITVADFMIAGGILIFVIALDTLFRDEKRQRQVDPESLGAVPLGVPLIAGPAVLTTSILLANEHGILPTLAAVVVNISIAGLMLWLSASITGALGRTGTKAISKIAALLLAAIAIMMVRKGIVMFVTGTQ